MISVDRSKREGGFRAACLRWATEQCDTRAGGALFLAPPALARCCPVRVRSCGAFSLLGSHRRYRAAHRVSRFRGLLLSAIYAQLS